MDRSYPQPTKPPVAATTVHGARSLPATDVEIMRVRKKRSLWSWVGVVTMGLVAAGSGVLSANLHDHANERRQLMDEITQAEVKATELSAKVWRALTMLMAEDKMQFIRLRGETGLQREDVIARVERIIALDRAGDAYNSFLGYQPQPESLETLDAATHSFIANIRGTLSHMKMATERTRKRLHRWDMNFGPFNDSLEALKARNDEIAGASAVVAKRVATAAGLSRLLASVLLVLTISRDRRSRNRRASDSALPGRRRSTDRLAAESEQEEREDLGADVEPTQEPDFQKAC